MATAHLGGLSWHFAPGSFRSETPLCENVSAQATTLFLAHRQRTNRPRVALLAVRLAPHAACERRFRGRM